jgi:hypothetical protein
MKYYRSFEAGQTVIWSGDRMDFVASVVTGIATLTQTMEDGRTPDGGPAAAVGFRRPAGARDGGL